jgi:catechol 1,2-dioxygenase
MRSLTEQNLTDAVVARLGHCGNARLRQLSESLIRHLHAFVRETELTPAEWFAGIEFLTRTGQMCDDKRQEFILLSDVLGVSMLVDAIANGKRPSATESTVLGPFYVEGAPERESGADLAACPGERVWVHGTVRDTAGRPLAGTVLDVWETAPNGLYHVQDKDQPEHHLCGKLKTDAEGRYSFVTLRPVSYPIPTDGPVGRYLQAVGRHPFRPAHIHFIVSHEGCKPVVTQLFSEGDEYLDSDPVFGVKDALVVRYEPSSRPGCEFEVAYDFVLDTAA